MSETNRSFDDQALRVHAEGRPGKIAIQITKPLATQNDLALAYSPGVAAPVRAIAEDTDMGYTYTARGNVVAVISNGTAILGLGNLGALASKPVMEGKAVLFKRFADIDGIDLEVDTQDIDAFINAVRYLGPSFGGINLEDIKAPDCFIIEERLRELMDIPVFHDDQHGTAIIAAAGLINACDLTGRALDSVKCVINGAGSAGVACAELFKSMGVTPDNVVMCDTKGVIYQGRTAGMNQWKSAHATKTEDRTLADALRGADVFLGVSVKGALTRDMLASMAANPIIFALANPDPEITPEEAATVRGDCYIATGRSDYPNQVNNVLGFPYIFRGALDVRAKTINQEMKVAAAEAIAALAREDVPEEVDAAYAGRTLRYGREYVIPTPFDPRLIATVPVAVARAATDTGVARQPLRDDAEYAHSLKTRFDPVLDRLERVFAQVRTKNNRVVFAEGEEERAVRAALAYQAGGYGQAILVGREDVVEQQIRVLGHDPSELTITNARLSTRNDVYTDYLYDRLRRRGHLRRDCQRQVNQGRNVFSALMVATGDADKMITGMTRPFFSNYNDIRSVLDPMPGHMVMGMTLLIARGQPLFLSDTTINERPSPEELAQIAAQTARAVRALGIEPRAAFLSYSNFGQPMRPLTERVIASVRALDDMDVDFEYDGEMTAEVALDYPLMQRLYPFCRLSGPANVLIMPALHTANVAAKMMQKVSGETVIGPLLLGLEKPVQIIQLGSTVTEILNTAILGAHAGLTNLNATRVDASAGG